MFTDETAMISNEHNTFLESIERSPELVDYFMERRQLCRAAIREVTTKLEVLDDEFSVLHEHNPIHHIESRLKSPRSALEKLQKKGKPLTREMLDEYINDMAGVRVICNYIEDAQLIAGLLIHQSDISLLRSRDYIARPKENGYRSLHLLIGVPVFLSTGVRTVKVEVQIRTISMDFWASLEHHLRYKTEADVPESLRKRLQVCAEQISLIDAEMQDIYTGIRKGSE